MPIVHLYCFVIGPENSQEVHDNCVALVEKHLGYPMRRAGSPEEPQILKVRQTASSTTEFCVSFRLPDDICY
jgi:hypothetical protein